MSSSSPRLLLLDTSGKGGFAALAQADTLLGELRLEETRRHARDLAPFIKQLLSERGWRPGDLDAVLVSLGPGSYTGLRVGVMSAKTLAYATGCALLGVETFAAVAAQAPPPVELVDVLADAQQDRVYVQSFARGAGTMTATAALKICEVSEWLAGRNAEAAVSGPGVEVHAARLAGLPFVEPALRVPTARGLLQVGWPRVLRGERDDLWQVEPIYLRPSAAEEQYNNPGKRRP